MSAWPACTCPGACGAERAGMSRRVVWCHSKFNRAPFGCERWTRIGDDRAGARPPHNCARIQCCLNPIVSVPAAQLR